MNRNLIVLLLGFLVFAGCRDKDLDMTVEKYLFSENVDFSDISVVDGWNVTIVQDDVQSYVELEHSAYLKDYLKYQTNGNDFYLGLQSHYNLPYNTVMNVIIHTPHVRKLHFYDAVNATLIGVFPETELTVEISDASTCKGGRFVGKADLLLSEAATLADFDFAGESCSLQLEDASTFKGVLSASNYLGVRVKDASHLTTYGGYVIHADVEVSDAGSLNMLETEVEMMHIIVKEASEASVFVTGTLEGSVKDASTLYYKGNPIINVECDDASIYPL